MSVQWPRYVVPRGPISLSEWEAIGETEEKLALVEGVVAMEPPASFGHFDGAHNLRALLNAALPKDRWKVLREPGVYLVKDFPPTARQPDICVFRRSAFDPKRHSAEARDVLLVVEFVSPGTRKTDQILKRHEYQETGIPDYWIVDLDAKEPRSRFTVLRLADGVYQEFDAFHDGRVAVPDLGGADVRFDFAELLD
jgi:Uma2 family endonuclease